MCDYSNSMAQTNSIFDSNSTMADSNSMADTDSMAKSNSMANTMTTSMGNTMSKSLADSMYSLTIICDLRHMASEVVGIVVDMLGPTVGEKHSVGSLSSSGTVVRLVLAEMGAGQVFIHAVAVGVGNNLSKASMTTEATVTAMTQELWSGKCLGSQSLCIRVFSV